MASMDVVLGILCVFIPTIFAYTDPTLSPVSIQDRFGNKADSSSKITWAPIPAGKNYSAPIGHTEDPALVPYISMVKGFSWMLQPADPNYAQLYELATGKTEYMAVLQDVIFYFFGFAFCFVLGILFLIVMPIVCGCFCCCRLCGKCGGKMKQRYPNKRAFYKCTCYSVVLSCVVIIMIAGAVMVFLMNDRMKVSAENLGKATTNNLNDISTYLLNTVDEISYTAVDGYGFASQVAKRDLDNIDALLGIDVRTAISSEASVGTTFQSIYDMDTKIDVSTTDTVATDTSQQAFGTKLDTVNTNLGSVKTELDALKSNAGCQASCQAIVTGGLVAGIDKTKLPNIQPNVVILKKLQQDDLSKTADEGKKDFTTIPEKIKNDTQTSVNDMKKMLDDFAKTAETQSKSLDTIKDNKAVVEQQAETIATYSDFLVQYDTFRSYGFLALAGFIWFIALFFVSGIFLGVCGYKKDAKPTERSGTSNCGGLCLMAGVGFCFIFSWLFMLLVTIPFTVGAPLDRFVCQGFDDPQNAVFRDFLDKQDTILGPGYFLGDMLLQDKTINLTLGGLLQDCKDNKAAYTAMRLSKMFDLDSMTNYKKNIDIEKELNNLNSDMSNIQVLSSETEKMLQDFKTATTIDYNAYDTELGKSLGTAGFSTFASNLRTIAADGTNSAAVNTKLTAQANAIDQVVSSDIPAAETAKADLIQKVNTMRTSSQGVPASVDNVIASAKNTENVVQTNGTAIVKQHASLYGNRILNTMDQYVNFTVYSIQNTIGACKPIWDVWDSLFNNALCNYFVRSFNGFWFALGWVVFFMIIAIIFGVKLAKYLRRMAHLDEDGISSTPVTPFDQNKVAPMPMPLPTISPPPSYNSQNFHKQHDPDDNNVDKSAQDTLESYDIDETASQSSQDPLAQNHQPQPNGEQPPPNGYNSAPQNAPQNTPSPEASGPNAGQPTPSAGDTTEMGSDLDANPGGE